MHESNWAPNYDLNIFAASSEPISRHPNQFEPLNFKELSKQILAISALQLIGNRSIERQ